MVDRGADVTAYSEFEVSLPRNLNCAEATGSALLLGGK